MPDQELFRLAGAVNSEKICPPKSNGCWRILGRSPGPKLHRPMAQARDIETVVIDARAILIQTRKWIRTPDKRRARFRELRTNPMRVSRWPRRRNGQNAGGICQKETTPCRPNCPAKFAARCAAKPRCILAPLFMKIEMWPSFSTAITRSSTSGWRAHYGLTNLNVSGDEMRRVTLPADSPRGGVLTMGGVLAVTSNPTRTSPVKRGLFVLDNLLGLPPAPAAAQYPAAGGRCEGFPWPRAHASRNARASSRQAPVQFLP